ncbi:hypothetical protein H8959_011445, partial [Pygathrix nigripes]
MGDIPAVGLSCWKSVLPAEALSARSGDFGSDASDSGAAAAA